MINLSKIVAAVLVVLAIALGVYAWMLGRKPPSSAPMASASAPQPARQVTFPVVFTTKAVQAGQPIPPDSLRIEQLPVNPPDAVREVEKAQGRIPVFDLGAGTPLLENQLVSGLALRVAEGERAVAIKADEMMGVGNKIRPGDFVDVFFVFSRNQSQEIDQGQARLLLARKRVLAFGNASIDGMPSADAQNANANGQRAELPRTAVLSVSVDEINKLAVSEGMGRLLLALRNPTDTTLPDANLFAELPTLLPMARAKPGQQAPVPLTDIDKALAGLTVTDFATGGAAPKNVKPPVPAPVVARAAPVRAPAVPAAARPPTRNEVELIKGDKRETLSY